MYVHANILAMSRPQLHIYNEGLKRILNNIRKRDIYYELLIIQGKMEKCFSYAVKLYVQEVYRSFIQLVIAVVKKKQKNLQIIQ